jgi:hypothetical protein
MKEKEKARVRHTCKIYEQEAKLKPRSTFLTVLYKGREHSLIMELDLQSLYGLYVQSCFDWLRPRIPLPPHLGSYTVRGRYWSAKIGDIPGQGVKRRCPLS